MARTSTGRPLVVWAAVSLFASCALSCSRAGPDEVANGFVDAYYIEFNFERAAKFAEGMAAQRLEEEQALAEEARESTSLEAQKARVYYGKPERRQLEADKVHYTYRLDIRQGQSTVEREAVVMVALRDGAWKVISFRESQPGLPRAPGVETGTTADRP